MPLGKLEAGVIWECWRPDTRMLLQKNLCYCSLAGGQKQPKGAGNNPKGQETIKKQTKKTDNSNNNNQHLYSACYVAGTVLLYPYFLNEKTEAQK